MDETIDIDEEGCCCAEAEGEDGKNPKVLLKMHCPEGEDADRVKEKVLLRLGSELGGRCNVVMTRLHDDDLKRIDGLVEVELFKSRSEAVAFFIKEGIQARKDLFESVMTTVEKIKALKEQAKKNLTKSS
ncbi:MAG: hypothetical protein JSV35_04040 [Candidatus Bathyarchaeota archaeon]|nr:MAG: hypothetical protein JSV35_04040 [Candidatus Bathyarchaeota archaeon]